TKETSTLQIKGLQPPALSQETASGEVAPNAEEIKLPAQKIRAGDATAIIDVALPPGYHLNPTAPQRYTITVEQGGESLKSAPMNVTKNTKGLALPIRIPIGVGAGAASVHASFTFVYCREDNTGVCRIKTLQWQVPVEVVSDASAATEIKLTSSVTAN